MSVTVTVLATPMTIGTHQAMAAIHTAAEQAGPGYRWPGWRPGQPQRYWPEPGQPGGPCCLVGAALHLCGVPPHALSALDTLALCVWEIHGLTLHHGARLLLRAAQRSQAEGNTWDVAAAAARDAYLQDLTRQDHISAHRARLRYAVWHEENTAHQQDTYLRGTS